MEAGAEHLDDVRVAHPRQLPPLDVELRLLHLGLEVLDGHIPRRVAARLVPHCPEHCAE